MDEWLKKMWSVFTMERYSTMRKRKSWLFTTTMDVDIMLSVICQREKDKNSYDISYMWNIKTNEHKEESGMVATRGWSGRIGG